MRLKKLNRNQKGQTLIEVVIAVALLGMIAVAFLGGLVTVFRADIIADERSVAQSLATSQMESVKSQVYNTSNTQAQYPKLPSSDIPSGYNIKSLDRNGNMFDDGAHIIGVPWDAVNGIASSTDNGIQKITLIICRNTPKELLTLEGYKVSRGEK